MKIDPIQKTKTYFNKCVDAITNYDDLIGNGSRAVEKINRYKLLTNFRIPAFEPQAKYSWPHPNDLGVALGLLSGVFETDTLVNPFVDVDYLNSQENARTFKLYLDQPRLHFPRVIYVGKAWDIFKDRYEALIKQTFVQYAKVDGVDYDDAQLDADVADILEFERLLATKHMTGEKTRRDAV